MSETPARASSSLRSRRAVMTRSAALTRAVAPRDASRTVARRRGVSRASKSGPFRALASSSPPSPPETPASRLRRALEQPGCVVMPSVYDALGAKLVARSGAFECAFMSGYGVSLSRLGDPDVGLASFADVLDAGTHVCRAAGSVPVGARARVRRPRTFRTVLEFHRAGFAAVSIEDRVFPRCAFAEGVRVVDRRTRRRGARRARRARRDPARRRRHPGDRPDGLPARDERGGRVRGGAVAVRRVRRNGRGRRLLRGASERTRDGRRSTRGAPVRRAPCWRRWSASLNIPAPS